MAPSVSGTAAQDKCLFSSTVSHLNVGVIVYYENLMAFLCLSNTVDQKKDIVAIFPDTQQSHVIHSCSADRSLCTYDLQQEKRIQMRQT